MNNTIDVSTEINIGGKDTNKNQLFNKLNEPVDMNCPLCGAKAEMWERVTERAASKAVMCSNGDGYAGLETCLLYLPPEPFYHATKREAQEFWRSFVIEQINRT